MDENGKIKIRCSFVAMVPIEKIVSMPNNANDHPETQIAELVEQFKYQGVRHPLIVWTEDGIMRAGHARLEAMKRLGLIEVPVDYQDFDNEDQAYAFSVADNATQSMSILNLARINLKIPELGPDFNIDRLGIADFRIEPMDKFVGSDEAPEPKEAFVRSGEIYILGEHKLLCGDSTKPEDVKKLMAEHKADLWITDPPYGVSYRSNGAEDKHREIENDSMPMDQMAEFWFKAASNAYEFCSDKAAYYWFACQGGDQMMMMMSISRAKWKVRHELIWKKDRLVLGRCDYHYKHEPILYGWKEEGTHEWHNDRSQTSVLEFSKPTSSDLHPTMKPVELVQYLLSNNTIRGQTVLDLFGGSGTTLIACEKASRKCRMIEIDPIYCGVILDRYELCSGKQAFREDGKTWAEVKSQ